MQAIHLFEDKWAGKLSTIMLFIIPIFFITLADSILSFIYPIISSDTLNSNTTMGLLMASSSIAGLISDFIFPQIFKYKTWKFFLIATILLALTFPISLHLGKEFMLVSAFLYGAIIWGIYFEFLMFAQQLFVVNEEKKTEFSKDWGLLALSWQLTAIIGPVIGSSLLLGGILNTSISIIFFQVISLIAALFIVGFLKEKKVTFSHNRDYKSNINVLTEIKYWGILITKVWPTITVGITITAINATFWTIGGIFGEKVFGESGMGWIIVSVFFLPMIIGSLIITKLKPSNFKKRISQTALIFGSIILCFIGLTDNHPIILILVLIISGIILSFVQPLNDAVYSDLLERLGEHKSHLLGISRANSSVAYIIAPLIVGVLSDSIGYGKTFSIIAIFALIIGLVTIIFSPRKIKLPQSLLYKMDKSNPSKKEIFTD